MKIDRSKLKKSSSEVPWDCKALIERLTSTNGDDESFLKELKEIETWTYGKCELLHWIDVLDLCDRVLGSAYDSGKWRFACDTNGGLKELVLWTLHFTTLLIEHSFSRHLYSSMEHLTALLSSSDLDIVLAVLNLLYMFSKRSNFITRLSPEKRGGLLSRLTHLAASWGGKDNGFGLSRCCTDGDISSFPESATTLHFEFYTEKSSAPKKSGAVTVIHIENVDRIKASPAEIMEDLLTTYQVPEDKRMQLFTYLRLAHSFSKYSKRLKCVQARLQALSVLIYSNQLAENVQSLLYSGLLEELVDVLEMKGDHLMEIKAAALKSLTSIIHLDRNPNFPKLNTIIDVTGASSYHGFLPVLVRSCISSLTATKEDSNSKAAQPFPQPLATALFSFLYHLASYEAGGEALVSCGMMESLLKVIQWPSTELDHITFVTRAVRVIDLITNLDMQSFQTHSGLSSFIVRLELEVEHCREQQPFQIQVGHNRQDSVGAEDESLMDTAEQQIEKPASVLESGPPDYSAAKTGLTCLPQRAALLKSMLNFLKKAIQDPSFADSIRHVMDGSLPNSLKHIISNAEYYGPSLFLLATDVVTAYVFQEPSLLSSLQDKGLTDVVLHALLVKDVPATREVLGSLPNVFSALCLNNRGLDAFVACKPFERLFKVLLSPVYLPAMRRRRSTDPMGDTASNLGNAMDELMRHQPLLKQAATGAIIKLLEEVCSLGRDPRYICWKAIQKNETPSSTNTSRSNTTNTAEPSGSSDEEEEEDEEPVTSVSSQQQQRQSTQSSQQQQSQQHESSQSQQSNSLQQQARSANSANNSSGKEAVPLVDYIHNVMKFVDAILSNNSTDDHCREFVQQKGLVPLMGILGLPNLPIDFPAQQACQSVAGVCKSILNLAHEPQVLKEGLLHLDDVLKSLDTLHIPLDPPGGSVLLHELVSSPNIGEATSNPQATPLLHHMSAAHAYIQMFIHVCRTGQSDIRTISVGHWGSELGLKVLKGLSRLYASLVWESTVLLALCSDDTLPPGCEFGKADMDKLLPFAGSSTGATSSAAATSNNDNEETLSPSSGTESNSSVTMAMENLSTEPEVVPMEVDNSTSSATAIEKKDNSKYNPSLHHQIKQIKPLLSASSRLGRALAELFALLVKLCVGTPLRQRRGQHIPPTPAPPSPPARAVASALTKLLASGLSWTPPATSPIPGFRLTFFTCSVGFTPPMLFDEKKFPFHLMLMKFVSSGGQKAFFDTFYWALSCGGKINPEDGLESNELPDGTGEFLDSWLMLLEKMVNPKTVLDSPHTLPAKPSGNFQPFDPIKYLMRTHKLAFYAVMKIWGKKPLKVYGPRMAESVLSILCHILKGEKIIAEKIVKEEEDKNTTMLAPRVASRFTNFPNNQSSTQMGLSDYIGDSLLSSATNNDAGNSSTTDTPQQGSSAQSAPPAAATESAVEVEPAPGFSFQDLQILMDMGFPRERCLESMGRTGSMDEATEYLLTAPQGSTNTEAEAPGTNAAAASAGGASSLSIEQEDLMRAIAMSLDVDVVSFQVSSSAEGNAEEDQQQSGKEEEEEEEDGVALNMQVIDEFTQQALPGCLSLLDTLPDTVFRTCDLLLAVFGRNGKNFKEEILRSLITEVRNSIEILLSTLTELENSTDPVKEDVFKTEQSNRAAVRIHLFILLFEECKLLCAKIVEESKVVPDMTKLLSVSYKVLKRGAGSVGTPKWMTPLLLFIDLHEKVILGMNRRASLTSVCSHCWRWYDISTGKWSSYTAANNKTIDDAFWSGEANTRITTGRRKYTIQFGTMMQANEETGNRRPIMISIKGKECQDSGKSESSNAMEVGGDEDKKMTDTDEEDVITTIPTAEGLGPEEKSMLLNACVGFVSIPVDSDALNAVLRLCLRLTQDFERAVEFARLGGVKLLLELTQASLFSGITSLATLLVRHVLEDPLTLRHTMEKVIRTSTLNSQTTFKELHYLLRGLAPAACRAPSLFVSVAKEILRFDDSLLNKRGEPEEEARLLVKSLPAKNPSALAPTLGDVSQSVICDLLNFLVKSSPDSMDSTSGTPDDNTEAETSTQAVIRNSSSGDLQGVLQPPPPNNSANGECSVKDLKKPLLSKSAVCKLLAELVKSYGGCAKLITDHIYEAGITENIKEDTSALAFLLDELLTSKTDKDISQLVKILVAALASCNHHPDAQSALVVEVKWALNRALSQQEGAVKHAKIQALTGLISTMIESCPSSAQQTQPPAFKQNQQCQMNNIVKIMLKRGLITDLARVPHALDLSSPNIAVTINSALKPLETLSRIVNQPTALVSSARKSKTDSSPPVGGAASTTGEGASSGLLGDIIEQEPNINEGTNTTNSEATRAQGDESVGPDAEATEHDVSTAAESIDPNSESQLQTVEEGNDEELDDMMDHLERDSSDTDPIITEVVECFEPNASSEQGHDSQDDSRFASHQSQDEEDRASESSQSDAAIEEETEDLIEEEEDEDGEEEDQEEDEEEDDDEDDEGGSPFDDDNEEFQQIEDAIFRLPNDQLDDQLDLMISQENPLHSHMDVGEPHVIHHLPLWSDVNGGSGVTADTGANSTNHVTPSHPLLMGRQTLETGNGNARNSASARSLPRNRGNILRPYFQLNSRAQNNPSTPAILQNFLGSNPQELITLGLRRSGGPLMMDIVGLSLLDTMDNDIPDLDSCTLGSGGRAALSLIPSALLRWNEESRVIDGESMHDCVTNLKPEIMEIVEKAKSEELKERRQKEEERKLMKKLQFNDKNDLDNRTSATTRDETAATSTLTTTTSAICSSDNAVMTTASTTSSAATTTTASASNEETGTISGRQAISQLAQDLAAAISTRVSCFPVFMPPTATTSSASSNVTSTASSSNPEQRVSPQEQPLQQSGYNISANSSTERAGGEGTENPPPLYPAFQSQGVQSRQEILPIVLAPLSPSPEAASTSGTATTTTTSSSSTTATADSVMAGTSSSSTTGDVAMESEQPRENLEETEGVFGDISYIPEPSTSGTSQNRDYSSILGDVDIPEGVDPSFLAALPEEMRQEVIEDQRRLQNIRQRAQQQNTESSGVTEVNPEFLAALPPNIQEEVLAQQRMEQQRQMAQVNPEAPVDPGEFLQTLPAGLRQSVLADMEDSQMAALPAEIAAEAQSLRREYEQRNRNIIQERFFNNGGGSLSSILRSSVSRFGNQYIIGNLMGRDAFRLSGSRFTEANTATITRERRHQAFLANSIRFRGRQLLDNEGLSCLLILLFIDDSKINTIRLHRILRNLCYHAPTRDWVVRCLLSILEKANETKEASNIQQSLYQQQPSKSKRSTTPMKPHHQSQQQQNSWLNISMDAALGFRANVFQVHRSLPPGKKCVEKGSISIHSGASAVVCRHTLEVLISLAKNFSIHFLPWRDQIMEKYNTTPAEKKKTVNKDTSWATPSSDFWETLLRLDMQSNSRKGKSVSRSHSSVSTLSMNDDDVNSVTIESSPFGQLLSMLSSPVIRRNSLLTDKLLRLLSLISIGRPDSVNKEDKKSKEEEDSSSMGVSTTISPPISADHLRLAVDVLTSKSCSEEGLEDVTALLLNLSHGPAPTRDTILQLLLKGAQELGNVVRSNVLDLQSELQGIKSSSSEGDRPGKDKGGLVDRFTKETVVLNAPSKVKGGSELQLPSMNALTNKTSSQAFFLRVLKVIIQLREAALLAMKKNMQQAKKSSDESSATAGNTEQNNEEQRMDIDEEDSNSIAAGGSSSNESQWKLESLCEQLSLDSLWDTLSDCLKDLAETPDHHAVLVLQASVEAFFLVHAASTQPDDKKKVQQKETRQEQLAHIQEQLADNKEMESSSSTSTNSVNTLSADTKKFLAFAETHRTVLNQILRQSTSHLADGTFSVLVDHTRVLDFDIKRRYFRTELERMDEGLRREDLAVHIRRENVFEESFRELHRRGPEEWKNRFYIVFEGEEGQDAGGLLREWYVIISREIFNPMYALFKTSPGDKVTYMIYESSQTNPNHLDYFKFVGRVIAKAIYDNKLLECYFTRSFYKHILGKPVKYTDMESEDYAFYKGLEFLTNNKVSDLGYDLTFSTEIQEFGVTEIRDLIPNGRNITVTEETKLDYIRLVCQMKMTGAIRKQLSAFLEGFYNIIPRRLISIFNEQELELLLSGLPTIDIEDLKANTEYHKYQSNSLQIIWFWRALRSFDQTDKAKFMQFVTGSSKVPLQGFALLEGMNGVQKFQIHRDDRATDRLPSAHTCFNQLDLPAYETYDKLRTYLLKAIHECSEGFGFA